MAKLTFKFKNFKEFQVDLKKLNRKVKEDIGSVTAEIAKRISDQSKKNLTLNKSVITGTLRRSMTFVFYQRQIYAECGTNVFYGPYVEFGTSRSSAKPYLGPAFEKWNPLYMRYLYLKLKAALPRG